jgi:hypothetical protein
VIQRLPGSGGKTGSANFETVQFNRSCTSPGGHNIDGRGGSSQASQVGDFPACSVEQVGNPQFPRPALEIHLVQLIA